MSTALRLLVLPVIGAAFLCLLLTAWVGEAVGDCWRLSCLRRGPTPALRSVATNSDGDRESDVDYESSARSVVPMLMGGEAQ